MEIYLFDLLDHLALKSNIVSLEISRNVNFFFKDFNNYLYSNYDIILFKLFWLIYWFILVPGFIIAFILWKYKDLVPNKKRPNNQNYEYAYVYFFYDVFFPYERLILYFTLNYSFYENEQLFFDYWCLFQDFIITKKCLSFSRGAFFLSFSCFYIKDFYYKDFTNLIGFCNYNQIYLTQVDNYIKDSLNYITNLTIWEKHLHNYMHLRIEDMKEDFKGYWDDFYFLELLLLNEEEVFAKRFLLKREREFYLSYLNKTLLRETEINLFFIIYWSDKKFFKKTLKLIYNENYKYNDYNVLEWLTLCSVAH